MTRCSGLELHQVDLQEFARYLRNKCQASVTINEMVVSQKSGVSVTKGPPQEIVIQGQMIRAIEEALTKRYMIPVRFIETKNTLPEKKKRK